MRNGIQRPVEAQNTSNSSHGSQVSYSLFSPKIKNNLDRLHVQSAQKDSGQSSTYNGTRKRIERK